MLSQPQITTVQLAFRSTDYLRHVNNIRQEKPQVTAADPKVVHMQGNVPQFAGSYNVQHKNENLSTLSTLGFWWRFWK